IVKPYKGKTTYNIFKKIDLFINGIVSFTDRPLILIFYLGFAISTISGVMIIDLLIRRLFFNVGLAGWTSLIISVWFLGGLIILFLGILGIYISKIFIETKQRPYTIIRQIYDANLLLEKK
ncbi:MAG: glycosyltransferase, partial [Dictyoglomus sp.]